MKYCNSIFLLLFLAIFCSPRYVDNFWIRRFGSAPTNFNLVDSIVGNNSYVVFRRVVAVSGYWVIKVSKFTLEGDFVYERQIHFPSWHLYFSNVLSMGDGNFLLASELGYVSPKLLLMKFDSDDGSIVWSKRILKSTNTYSSEIMKSEVEYDTYYIGAVWYDEFNWALIKIRGNGTFVDARQTTTTSMVVPYGVKLIPGTADKIVMACYVGQGTHRVSTTGSDTVLFLWDGPSLTVDKTISLGREGVSHVTFSTNSLPSSQPSGTAHFIGGRIDTTPKGMFITKIDSDMNLKWFSVFEAPAGKSGNIRDILVDPTDGEDNNLLITGNANYDTDTALNFLAKLNGTTGQVIWSRRFLDTKEQIWATKMFPGNISNKFVLPFPMFRNPVGGIEVTELHILDINHEFPRFCGSEDWTKMSDYYVDSTSLMLQMNVAETTISVTPTITDHPSIDFLVTSLADSTEDVVVEDRCSGGRGICLYGEPDEYCEDCEAPYVGRSCEISTCFGLLSNDSLVCNGNGTCIDTNNCTCSNYTEQFGEYCEAWTCGGWYMNDTENVCAGKGRCISYDVCDCPEGYNETAGCGYSCYGFGYYETQDVCRGRGKCLDHDECDCPAQYEGDECQNFYCFNISNSNETNVCFEGHGTCKDFDNCQCFPGYTSVVPGGECSEWECSGVSRNVNDSNLVCSGNGVCVASETCLCDTGYESKDCSSFKCGQVNYDDETNVCSGRGECSGPNICNCTDTSEYEYYGVFGRECEVKIGKQIVLATQQTLLIHFEIKTEYLRTLFGLTLNEDDQTPPFPCSIFLNVHPTSYKKVEDQEDQIYNNLLIGLFAWNNCSLSSINEFSVYSGSTQYLKIHLDHHTINEFKFILKKSNQELTIYLFDESKQHHIQFFPSLEHIDSPNRFTLKSFSQSEEISKLSSISSNDQLFNLEKNPSLESQICKPKLQIDEDQCIQMFDCYASIYEPGQVELYSYYSIGFVPSSSDHSYRYARFYFQTKEECVSKSHSFQFYKVFSKVGCYGSTTYQDNFFMYDACYEDVMEEFFSSSLLGYFLMTTSPLYLVLFLCTFFYCCCSVNCVLCCCRDWMRCVHIWCFDWFRKSDISHFSNKFVEKECDDQEVLDESNNEEKEEDEMESLDYVEEFHVSTVEKESSEENVVDEDSTDSSEEENEGGEEEDAILRVESDEGSNQHQVIEAENNDTNNTQTDSSSSSSNNEQTEKSCDNLKNNNDDDDPYLATPKEEIYQVDNLMEQERCSLLSPQELLDFYSTTRSNLLKELDIPTTPQEESEKMEESYSFQEFQKQANIFFQQKTNQSLLQSHIFLNNNNQSRRTLTRKMTTNQITKYLLKWWCKLSCFVPSCFGCCCFKCCCCCCLFELLKVFLMIFGILLKEGFALWFASSEFLDASDIDASNPDFILLTTIMDVSRYVIWGSIGLYLLLLFNLIICFTKTFLRDPFLFCVSYGCLKEYVYFRIFKVVVLLWFICVNFFSYIVKFAYLDRFEQEKQLLDPNFWFSIIFPQTLLFFALFEVLGYNGVSSNAHLKRLKKLGVVKFCNFPKVKIGIFRVLKDVDALLEDFFQLIFLIDEDRSILDEVDLKNAGNRAPTSNKMKLISHLRNSNEYGHLSWEFLDGLEFDQILYLKDFFFPGIDSIEKETYLNIFLHHRMASLKWILNLLCFPILCITDQR